MIPVAMMPMLLLVAAGTVGWLLAPAAATLAQSSRDVLRRAGEYVVEYGDALAAVIGEEVYVQRLVSRDGATLESRNLHSEIAFISLGTEGEWQAFRNVLRVDGAPVAGADRRLETVLRDLPRSTAAQARLIARESAAFNLGPLQRTFNAPTMPLQFLHPLHQERARFDRRRDEVIAGERVWVVRMRERSRSTLIRRPDGRDVPVEGLIWIAPADGRVLRVSFFVRDFLPAEPPGPASRADIDVTWRPDERLGILVPAEMHERYVGPWTHAGQPYEIMGHARYSNYRRFEVDVRIGPVKQ